MLATSTFAGFRVKEDPAFMYDGVDLHTHCSYAMKLLAVAVRYGLGCLITQAIDLDIMPNLSTEIFIQCLNLFAARHGLPCKFISDNGKTFKAAAMYIGTIFKDKTVQEHLTN